MSDDRLFDVFQTLNQRLVPEPDYADRLLDTLLAEAGLGPTGRATRGWRFWRAGPARMEIPAPGLRLALTLLILVALLSVTVAVVGTFVLRLQEGFVETRVHVADIQAGASWSLDTLASEGDVGGQPALGYGPDDVPVVAYYDNEGERVVVARCTDIACSSLGQVADAGGVVTNLAESFGYIAVGPAGETWVARTISGADGDLERVEVQRVCPEPAGACEPLAATDLGPGIRPLIRVRADGRPVVLFGSLGNDASPDTSRLVVCGDPACEEGNRTTTVPVSSWMRDFVLTSSGLPLFVTSSNEATTLVSCLDDACTRTSTTSLGPGRQPRLAQDAQERPVIVAVAGRSVVLYRCADVGCSGGTWSSLADLGPAPSGSDESLSLDLLVAPDDRPFVSVSAGGELQLIACSTSACRDATKVTLDATSPAWAAPHALGITVDGLPFVAYSARSDLKVARCLVPECLTPNVASSEASVTAAASPSASQPDGLVRTLIDSGTAQFDPAVVIGADGLPVAAYSSGGELRVVHCGDIRCEGGNTTTTVGTAIVQAIALGPDGYPALGFIADDNSLSVARCQDAACSHPSIAPVREEADWTQYVAIVVPSDDRPIVAFADSQTRVRLARCADPSCTTAEEVVVDPNPDASWVNSLELRLGRDGLPVLGYALAAQGVRIARCSDLACTAPTVTTVGTDTGDLVTSALEIGADGIPVMAYYSDGSLLFARCDDLPCATVTSIRVDDATAGWWTPIGVGIDQLGLPLITYFSPTNRDTKIALCEDTSCSDAELVPLEASDVKGSNEETGISFLPDGSPIFVYVREGLFAEVCTDPRCGG